MLKYCNELKKWLKQQLFYDYCLRIKQHPDEVIIFIEDDTLRISSNMYPINAENSHQLFSDNFSNKNIILNLLLSKNKYNIELGLNLLKNYEN